jgi:hypothetical protein
LPSYPVEKQSKIIIACMALHSFIRDHDLDDSDFQSDVQDDSDPRSCLGEGTVSGDENDMGALRDAIAAAVAISVTFVPDTLVTKFLLVIVL